MAFDSQQKRMSVVGVARPCMRRPFPVATPTVQWRASVGLIYSGVAANLNALIVIANLVLGLVLKMVLPIAFELTDTDRREL